MNCTRCGAEAHDYGTDGLAYCDSCIFYGMNKPCWKCRMYLPASELQTYKGQFTCPYCIMDMRDEEKRTEEAITRRKDERYASSYQLPETCERCGRELSMAYFFNGRHLCSSCYQTERDEWKTVGGEKPPMAMFRVRQEKARKAKIVAVVNRKLNELFGFILRPFAGKKKKESDVEKEKQQEQDNGQKKPAKEWSVAKPALDRLPKSKVLVQQTTKEQMQSFAIQEPDKLQQAKAGPQQKQVGRTKKKYKGEK